MKKRQHWKHILTIALLLNLFTIYSPAIAGGSSSITITSPPSAPSYSQQLGVQAAPVTVMVDSVEEHGLFIFTDPNKPLGKALKLHQNYLLLTFDGFAVTSVKRVDDYLAQRPKNKTLVYTYITSISGTSSEGQVRTGKYDANPGAAQPPDKPAKSK